METLLLITIILLLLLVFIQTSFLVYTMLPKTMRKKKVSLPRQATTPTSLGEEALPTGKTDVELMMEKEKDEKKKQNEENEIQEQIKTQMLKSREAMDKTFKEIMLGETKDGEK